MPSMSNITINDKAGASVTLTAMTPSAGDSIPARWRIETVNPPAFRPVMTTSAKKSGGSGDVRRVSVDFAVPNPVTVNGVMANDGVVRILMDFVVPQNVPTSVVNDAWAYFRTFCNNSLAVAVMESQIAPT